MASLKKILLAGALLLDNKPLAMQEYSPEKMYQNYWRDYSKEFLACVYGDSMPSKYYLPKQTASSGFVEADSCVHKKDYLGTVHSHLTHNDEYLCSPSPHDWSSFREGQDKLMGIVCHNGIWWYEIVR